MLIEQQLREQKEKEHERKLSSESQASSRISELGENTQAKAETEEVEKPQKKSEKRNADSGDDSQPKKRKRKSKKDKLDRGITREAAAAAAAALVPDYDSSMHYQLWSEIFVIFLVDFATLFLKKFIEVKLKLKDIKVPNLYYRILQNDFILIRSDFQPFYSRIPKVLTRQ